MPVIAVVDRAEKLRVIELVSDDLAVGFEADVVRWPAWLGDGRQLVHSALVDGRQAVLARDTADSTALPATLFQNEPGIDGVLGPGTPHYVSPSPNGDFVAIVAPAAEGMALTLARTATGEAVLRIPGAPIFPAWSADGRHVAVHFGSDLLVIEPATGQSRDVVMGDAVGFRTPAVASKGELAYVARSGRTVAV